MTKRAIALPGRSTAAKAEAAISSFDQKIDGGAISSVGGVGWAAPSSWTRCVS